MRNHRFITMSMLLLWVSACSVLQAQNRFSGGFGYISLGSSKIENQAINQIHNQEGYPSFAPASLVLNGGGFGVIKGILIGGEGGVITPGTVAGAGYSSTLTTGYGMIQLGIMPRIPFITNKTGQIFAVLGVGRGVTVYELQKEFWGSQSFNIDYKGISEQLLMKFELNLASFPFTLSKQDQSSGLLAGLSAGYLMNPQSNSIHSETQYFPYSPYVGPQAYTSGWYFTLRLGGGGMKKK